MRRVCMHPQIPLLSFTTSFANSITRCFVLSCQHAAYAKMNRCNRTQNDRDALQQNGSDTYTARRDMKRRERLSATLGPAGPPLCCDAALLVHALGCRAGLPALGCAPLLAP
jgi:hypothetical protein